MSHDQRDWEEETKDRQHRVNWWRQKRDKATYATQVHCQLATANLYATEGPGTPSYGDEEVDREIRQQEREERARWKTQAVFLTQQLELSEPPKVRYGGEVIPRCNGTEGDLKIIDTLAHPDLTAASASYSRAFLAMQVGGPGDGALEMAVDAADSIQAQNSLEKMLAHQMAALHIMAMRFADHALMRAPRNTVEAARCANTAARCMSVYQEGLMALRRLRNGNSQTVNVVHQHVNAPGGQVAMTGTTNR